MNTPTFPPQTAAQINASQTGQVTLSPYDPEEIAKNVAPARAAEALGMEQDQKVSLKLPRAQLIEAVKNARSIPLVWQEVLLAEIAIIPPQHDLIRLDFVRHAHGAGANFTGTVKEI